jgi:tRNA U34 5-methylaminomethyl-2-thiouridine-forming methyltransferase MnmC
MTKIVTTRDGSHTIYVTELAEHYHSVHGAITESKHIFIEAGFKQCRKKNLNILEMGFGTGLNALLTLAETYKSDRSVYYTGIEKYPLPKTITDSLNFESLTGKAVKGMLKLIHEAAWNKEVEIRNGFILKKIECDMKQINQQDEFDLVYFDAFAPEKQPELWTKALFSRVYKSMRHNSILTTYSSKVTIRHNMENAGFLVEKIPGPPGKREMTRARKT